MSIDKTVAYVLKTLPYRESSAIFQLLTQNQGLIHGIAKGIRKKKTSASFLERGFLIETLVYSKPHGDLCILGDIQVLNFFPKTRMSLIENAIRDAMFEMIMATVSVHHPYPELFQLVKRFLEFIEALSGVKKMPLLLWKFYQEFAECMGFGFNIKKCMACQKALSDFIGGYLIVDKGGLLCETCTQQKVIAQFVPKQALEFLESSAIILNNNEINAFTPSEIRRLTRLFARYCQFHCDSRYEHKALEFLDSLLV